MTQTLALVALGGATGSVLRYLVTLAGRAVMPGFPLGTLVVNVLGSFVMGLLFVTLTRKGAPQAAPLLMTGLLGGFTTFSAFSLDSLTLWQRGDTTSAALYVALSLTLSLAAVALGAALARSFA